MGFPALSFEGLYRYPAHEVVHFRWTSAMPAWRQPVLDIALILDAYDEIVAVLSHAPLPTPRRWPDSIGAPPDARAPRAELAMSGYELVLAGDFSVSLCECEPEAR
ncbi:hypothetical protein KFE25_008631 [Diacronema lutheri]|uniref:Uncharacterized protein n=1 Tax=Diacronema lutheri TaxID=2081491 RepID=A0A8J6CHH5_DIALT|nr:hypothetical protein KFE25_008631 [Diacronema lutheri]